MEEAEAVKTQDAAGMKGGGGDAGGDEVDVRGRIMPFIIPGCLPFIELLPRNVCL